MKKKLLSIILLFLAGLSAAQAYDFSAVAPTGQTLYYSIIPSTTTVCVEAPNYILDFDHYYWGDHAKPTGNLSIPSSVSYQGTAYTVTDIGSYAFFSCDSIVSITIPNSVTSIGEGAFLDCFSLASVTIPNSVTSIGEGAFSYCYSLASVTIPSSVTLIGNSAFSNCSSLASVTIPNSVTTIGDGAFSNCSSLASVTIPNTVTTIGNWTFSGCTSLASVTIPNSVTTIGYEAFRGCTSLASVIIPNSVTTIGSKAFYDCVSLASVTIPNSVTTIGNEAFSGCSSLAPVTIPNSVIEIGYEAFYNVRMIFYNGPATGAPWGAWCLNGYVEDGLYYTSSLKDTLIGAHVAIVSAIVPNTVTTIGYEAFWGCTSLASVTIPNSVTKIEYNAFSGCTRLAPITIPNTVATIGNRAFGNVRMIYYNGAATGAPWGAFCMNGYVEDSLYYTSSSKDTLTGAHVAIVRANVPNTVTMIRGGSFSGCTSLTSLTIPNSVTSIGGGAFSGCFSLASVTIPNSVTSIGEGAFSNCTSLASVTIPSSVTSIGNSAFSNCTSLASVTIPNNVTKLGSRAFQYCSGLVSAIIGADTIGAEAFYECTNLSTISITESVKALSYRIFWNCKKLKTVYFDADDCVHIFGPGQSVYYVEPPFMSCDSLHNLFFGNHVRSISSPYIFSDTPFSLIQFGDSTTTIGAKAFSHCYNLTKLVLGDAVVSIGENAFQNCSSLDTVYIGKGTKAISLNAFDGCDSLSVIHFNAENFQYSYRYIFERLGGLRSLIIGNAVRELPSNLFRYSSQIEAVYIKGDSNQIATIGANAFNGCSNMAGHIVVPHITSLGDGAFSGCGMISSVELGNGLSAICDTVFKGCDHMTNVTLGRGVQSVADNAFDGCTEIRLLTSRALNPPTIYRTTFEDVDDDISVRVPCEAVAAYQNAPFWSHFNNIEGRFDFFFSATSADITKGSVTIVHAPVCDNIEAHIQANPYHGYRFSHWSDGNTDNPRYIVVTQDTIITAHFEEIVGIDTPLLHPAHYSQEGNRIVVNGAEGQNVRVFDIMGKLISSQPNVPEPFSIYLPAAGVYLIQIGSSTPQKIVVH